MITRSLICGFVCLIAPALAAPPLTTIQDTLYRADGTRFTGTLNIAWESFEGPNATAIVKQSLNVKVLDGYLKVQLVPTATSTPYSLYKVTYNSDGRVQFQEWWNVPSATASQCVRDVRVTTGVVGGGSVPDTGAAIQESDVAGLAGDLAVRPIKGPAYAAGRVALVNDDGMLDAVTGSPADCVRVDGSAGPCGSSQATFIEGETPAGIVDGANTNFNLTNTPGPSDSLAVYRNGLRQKAGVDYTSTGHTIQFLAQAVPQAGDTLIASYRVADSADASAPQIYPASQVVCSGIGATLNSTSTGTLAYCTLPAAAILPGDRLEVRFDLEHQGTAGGYTFDVLWGSTAVLTRTASVSDTLAAVRMDVAVLSSGTQVSAQSWGTVLPLSATTGTATDVVSSGLTLAFRGHVAVAGDTLSLRNFTVTRLP